MSVDQPTNQKAVFPAHEAPAPIEGHYCLETHVPHGQLELLEPALGCPMNEIL